MKTIRRSLIGLGAGVLAAVGCTESGAVSEHATRVAQAASAGTCTTADSLTQVEAGTGLTCNSYDTLNGSSYCVYDQSTLGQEYGGSVQYPYRPTKVTLTGWVSGHDFTTDPNANFHCFYDPTSANACNKPNVASGDFSWIHNDRDFNIQIVPTDASRCAIDSTYMRYANCAGQASIDTEVEFMDFFPVLDSRNYDGQTFGPNNPDLYVTRDGFILGSPGAGDQIVTMGLLADDCGEVDAEGARREIHPPVATAWRQKNAISSITQSDAIVWIRASSHYRHNREAMFNDWPSRPEAGPAAEQWEGPFVATFDIPHNANSVGPMYVGPVVSDWLVSPTDYANTPNPFVPGATKGEIYPESSSSFDPQAPNALWEWAYPTSSGTSWVPYSTPDMKTMYDANDYFSVVPTVDDTNHQVTITVTPKAGKEAYGDLPNLMGAHVQACYLECVNGVKQNNCPGTCPCGTNVCAGHDCGTVENCGQQVSCGTCPSNDTCSRASGSTAGTCIFDCSTCVDPMYCNASQTGCVCDPCTTSIKSACTKQGLHCVCGSCE